MRRRTVTLLGLAPLIAAGSCETRAPGPSEEDRGQITHWVIRSASQSFETCSDEAEFRADFGDPRALEGSAVSYRVSQDGRSAEGLACTSTAEEDCVPLEPARVYTIEDHTLSAAIGPIDVPVEGLECEQQLAGQWVLTDDGDQLRMVRSLAYELTGTSTGCAAVDAAYRALSSNGTGIVDCKITLEAEAEFVP